MKQLTSLKILLLIMVIPPVYAFESGSTGVDGAFNPSSNTQLTLPPSGMFNFTDVTIPAGVTVTFAKNAANTPVTILASGDVTIEGTINVNGSGGGGFDNGSAGIGGPGGFNGGRGGFRSSASNLQAGNGLGPGGGEGAPNCNVCSGAGGSYSTQGENGSVLNGQGETGPTYNDITLRTLIGGSGGGGAAGGNNLGPGGGGGGGAILIAASGVITVNGVIAARGGVGGARNSTGNAGAGSGGVIRLVATTIQGEGNITAERRVSNVFQNGGNGRIRFEAENFLRTSPTIPGYSFDTPKAIFFSNFPSVRITTIGGEAVPSSPTGFRDVVLTGTTTNPVTIGFETTNVPVGTTISLKASPERGTATTATSTPVAGSATLGTASANINLPNGNSTLLGQASFTATVADNFNAAEFSKYAQGEKVEQFRIDVDTNGILKTTFITVSGKEFTYPSNALAMN